MNTVLVDEIWKQACAVLQQNLSPTAYNTWIALNPLTEFRLIGDDRAIGVITSPTAFHSANLEKNFYAQIKEVLDTITGRNSELQFRVGALPTPSTSSSPVPVTVQAVDSSPTRVSTPNLGSPASDQSQTLDLESQPPIQTSTPDQAVPGPVTPTSMAFVPSPVASDPTRFQNQPHANVTPVGSFIENPAADTVQAMPALPITAMQERLLELAQKSHLEPSAFRPSQISASPTRARSTQSHQTAFSSPDLFSPATLQAVSIDRARLQAQRAGLRLDYTFDTFAVSTTNEMAHAAAQAVSSQPGTAYNPLFIYGGVGVGKTHLMHAVGNNILKNNPDSRILYCTGEDFTNEIVNAIQTKKAMSFKEKYRTVDVLLIDDVQFIAGKNAVQEEFFHTFNTLTKRFGQIILTSDRPPHEIALLEDRLRSRFEAGLMVDIQQPSFELRAAILLIKANSYHLDIPMDLAQIIASKVDSARKIEGIMKSIKSEVELKKRTITPALIEEILRVETDKSFHQRLKVKPYDVIKTVADFYHIKQVTIRGQQRVQSVVKARHIAMFLLKEELGLPYVEIGRWFSNRDHTSAMHALKKVQSELTEDLELRQELEEIRRLLLKISK